MSPAWRTGLALLWLALLVAAGWAVSQRLELSGDLRKFMSAQNTNSREPMPDAARAAGAARQPAAFPAAPAGIHA